MKRNSLIALVCLLCCALPALAQINGDYRSVASGNWDAAATWEMYNGATWNAAGAKPGATNNVYLQAGFIVTLTGDESCLNFAIHNAAADSIVLGSHTLSVNGSIAQFSSAAGTFPVTYSTTANQKISTALGGKISVVGNSRMVFNSGQWSANPQRWNLDISMNPAQICSSATNVKAGRITVTSGTLYVPGALRPDSAVANTGSLLIASGATVVVGGSVSRTGTLTAQCGLIDINGTLQIGGGNISATNINVNSGGTYACAKDSGQIVTGALAYSSGSTLSYVGIVPQMTRNELPASLYNLIIDNPNSVLLNTPTTVSNRLTLNAGVLNNTANNVTLSGAINVYRYNGSIAVAPIYSGICFITYGGDYDITTGPELPPIGPTEIAGLYVDKGTSRLSLGHSISVVQLHMAGGEVYSASDTVSIPYDSPVDYAGGWVNAALSMYVPTGAVTRNFPVGTANGYSPVAVSFNNVITPGMLTAQAVQGPEPHAAYPDSVLQRYWAINGDGALAFDYYTATIGYRSADFTPWFTEAGDETTMVAATYGSSWSFPSIQSLDTVNNLATMQGTTILGDITLGKVVGAFIATADTTKPYVTGTSPANGAVDVALNAPVVIAFSEPMDTAGMGIGSNPYMPFTHAWNGTADTITLYPTSNYSYNALYTVVFQGTDLASNPLNPYPDSISFTSAANPAPVINVVVKPADTYDGTGPFLVRAVITDPGKKGAKSIVADTLYYTTGGAWQYVLNSGASGDTVSYNIPGGLGGGVVVEYYIGAYDDAGAVSWMPSQNAGYMFRILNLLAPSGLNATAGNAQVQLGWAPPVDDLNYSSTPYDAAPMPATAIASTRFTPMHYPCKLEQAISLWYNNSGMDSLIVHVYADDGTGMPDTAAQLVTPFRILPEAYPNETVVDLSPYNIVLASGDFHVGYELVTTGVPFVVYDGAPAVSLRSLYRWDDGIWYTDLGHNWNQAMYVSYSSYSKGLALKSAKAGAGRLPQHAMAAGRGLQPTTIANRQAVRYAKLHGAMAMAKNIHNYEVYRGDATGGPYTSVGTATDTMYTDNTALNGSTYYYVVRANYVSPDTFSGYSNEASATPSGVAGVPGSGAWAFSLAPVSPNPVHGAATFRFSLAAAAQAKLEVFNITGQRVSTVASGTLAAGPHSVSWNGCDGNGRRVASGVYIYQLTAGNNTATRRLAIIR